MIAIQIFVAFFQKDVAAATSARLGFFVVQELEFGDALVGRGISRLRICFPRLFKSLVSAACNDCGIFEQIQLQINFGAIHIAQIRPGARRPVLRACGEPAPESAALSSNCRAGNAFAKFRGPQ